MDQKQSMGAELIQSINLWFEKLLNLQIGNTSLYENELIKNNLNMINIEKELKNIIDNSNQLPQRVDKNHNNHSFDNLKNGLDKFELNMMHKINYAVQNMNNNIEKTLQNSLKRLENKMTESFASESNLSLKYLLGLEYKLNEMELNHLNNYNNLRRDVLNKCTPANEVLLDTSYAPSLTTEHDIILFTTGLRGNNTANISIPKENDKILQHNNINNTNNIEILSAAATTVTEEIPNEIEIETASYAKSQQVYDVPTHVVVTSSSHTNNNGGLAPQPPSEKEIKKKNRKNRKKKHKNKIKNNIGNKNVKNKKKMPLQTIARTIEIDRVMEIEQAKHQAKQNIMKPFNEWDFG